MRRPVVLAVVAAAVVAAVVAVQHHRATRATVPKVASAVDRGATVPRARLRPFPAWSMRGWRLVGGRSDRVGGRDVTTAYYRRGARTVTYSAVAGSHMVIDGGAVLSRTVERRGGKFELNWQSGPHSLVARVVPPHRAQFILTGRPASEALRREMTRLALLAG